MGIKSYFDPNSIGVFSHSTWYTRPRWREKHRGGRIGTPSCWAAGEDWLPTAPVSDSQTPAAPPRSVERSPAKPAMSAGAFLRRPYYLPAPKRPELLSPGHPTAPWADDTRPGNHGAPFAAQRSDVKGLVVPRLWILRDVLTRGHPHTRLAAGGMARSAFP